MNNFSKEPRDSHRLRVTSALVQKKDYFLSNFPYDGFSSELDFFWEKNQKIKASITFVLSDSGLALSLPQVPFGGFWTESNLSSASLEAFILALITEMKSREIRSISLTQPPKPYNSQTDLVNYLLFKNGFKQTKVLSHQFFIGKKKIKKLVQRESVKFQKGIKDSGLKISSSSISNFGFLEAIRTWNVQRGYDVAIDENRIVQQVSAYPERYFLITVSQHDVAIGYSLAVQLTSDSLYYFLSAMNPKTTTKNGGQLMVNELFRLALDLRVNFIDLGSSDLEAGANHSLLFFKSRFANDFSNKVTWIKEL